MNKALVIIDMQKISFTVETPRYDSEGVIKRINSLAEKFRKSGQQVIFIQHDGSKQDFCIPQTIEWEILDELIVDPSDAVIAKSANDSFYQTSLDHFLKTNKIEELLITGCATDYCVEATIHGALTRDYKVTVVKDGHTTADRPFAKAKTLIDHYNSVWADLSPTKHQVTVVESCKINI